MKAVIMDFSEQLRLIDSLVVGTKELGFAMLVGHGLGSYGTHRS